MSRIASAYDADPEFEWQRLEGHRVEYGLTMRTFEEHLPPAPAKIIDVGGSVGRYSIELARRGYEVTLVDIAGKCLDFARAKAAEAGVELAGVVKADARDLSGFVDESFDAALLMGPLYHLLEHGQRVEAAREVRRILQPDGLVFAAFITPYIIVQSALVREIEYISRNRQQLDSILTTGLYHPTSTQRFPDAWYSRCEQVDPLMVEGGFAQVDFLNTEALARELEEKLNAAPEELHRQWLDLLYRLARDPSIMGGGGHLLYVGKKENARLGPPRRREAEEG